MKNIFRIFVLIISTLAGTNVLNAQWVIQNSTTTTTLTDVVMLDTVTAIAVGRDGAILRTTNAGATWFNQTAHLSFIRPWNGISFIDKSNGIVVGDQGVVTTTDGGNNWRWWTLPGMQKCLSALHISPANIYVGADSGWIYHSLDSGKTWTSEKISAWPIRSVFAWPGPSSVGLPVFALTPYSLCEKLEYSSGPWQETILTNFQGLGSEAFSGEVCNSGGAGFIVGVQGDWRAAPAIIRKKSISDIVWSGVSQNILRDGELHGVSAPSINVIYVCGSLGIILKSTNGGDTWIAPTIPTSRNLNAIYFYDEKRGFAVGDSGLILYTSNGGVTSVGDQEGHPPTRFMLCQNYPNPFNPSTTISFSLPSRSFVSIKIFDLVGRNVATLISENLSAGNHSRQWNAAALPSGVYFYRLVANAIPSGQAGSFTETKKLLLLR